MNFSLSSAYHCILETFSGTLTEEKARFAVLRCSGSTSSSSRIPQDPHGLLRSVNPLPGGFRILIQLMLSLKFPNPLTDVFRVTRGCERNLLDVQKKLYLEAGLMHNTQHLQALRPTDDERHRQVVAMYQDATPL